MEALKQTLSGRKVGARVRTRTPPRITEHKPPLPEAPPPTRGCTPSVVAVVSGAGSGGAGATPAAAGAGAGAALSASAVGAGGVAATGAGTAAPTTATGYMTKKGEVANFLTGTSWKRRWFVLERGELTYYSDQSSWIRGEKPLKGHRVDVRGYQVVRDTDGADVSLRPAPAAAASGPASSAGGGGKGSSGGGGGGDSRTWHFVCDSKAEMGRWESALLAHGAEAPPAGSPASSSRWLL